MPLSRRVQCGGANLDPDANIPEICTCSTTPMSSLRPAVGQNYNEQETGASRDFPPALEASFVNTQSLFKGAEGSLVYAAD
jgi:hypothetical protein